MNKSEKQALDDIDRHGCHILHVLDDEDNPRFSYSIGIEATTGKPDLVICGLKQEVSQWMINEYYERVSSGELFQAAVAYHGFLEGFDVQFINVDKSHCKEYFGWGLWYSKGSDFQMLQLVYPSTSGIWPWGSEAPGDFTWLQPLLNQRC